VNPSASDGNCWGACAGKQTNADFDELAVYGTALSAATIQAHYNARSTSGTGTDTTPPAAVTNLATSSPSSSTVVLTWTAPGDDGSAGTAASYDLRRSASPITSDALFNAATPVAGTVPAPAAAGTSQNMTVTGLSASTTYYFAIKTKDEALNTSAVSNSPSATTSASGNPWSVPFLGRTPSGVLTVDGQSNVTVTGKQFQNLGDGVVALVISNSNNVTVTANDFDNTTGGIYCINSTNVTITWNRFRNIGNNTIGSGHSNYIQFNNCWGGYIAHNKGIGGLTEDMVSIYMSGGVDSAHPLIIELNAFESPLTDLPNIRSWTSGSGSGFMLADSGGHDITVQNNTVLTPGQVGIGIPGGQRVRVLNNTLYGAKRTGANVGIYMVNYSGGAYGGHEVSGNQIKWVNAAGNDNPMYLPDDTGSTIGANDTNWAGDPATLHVTL
jgi:hypothetical protein